MPCCTSPMPHGLIIENPTAQTIVLERIDPAVVGHAQLAEHAAAFPRQDGRVEVAGWGGDEDFLGVLRHRGAQFGFEIGAEVRRLGRAADEHDAAEEFAATAVIGAAGVLDGGENGLVQGHEGHGAVDEVRVGLRAVQVVGACLAVGGVFASGRRRAKIVWRGRAGDGGPRRAFFVSVQMAGKGEWLLLLVQDGCRWCLSRAYGLSGGRCHH